MVAQTQVPTVPMQGVVVPKSAINPDLFFARTRGMRLRMDGFSHPGPGGSYDQSLRQVGIIAGLWVTFSGELTVTLAAGTCATSALWPYGLIRNLKFSANGQSNLINTGGWDLKAREIMQRGDLSDRGVARGIGGASPGTARTQGTLSLHSEEWGVGQNVTAIPGAPTVYPVELCVWVPIAMDKLTLTGAIFAQTSATDLALSIDFATDAQLFTFTGAATAVLTGDWTVEAEVYTIPSQGDGIVVPDLSVFHSIIKTRFAAPSQGLNEVRLAGQGVGRQLQRLWFRTFSGATPVPLALDDVNYGNIGWRYGGNDTPEVWQTGRKLAQYQEDLFDCDLGAFQGFAVLDWASEFAFRDSIDEGAATELRLLAELLPAMVGPYIEYNQETLFAGSVGA